MATTPDPLRPVDGTLDKTDKGIDDLHHHLDNATVAAQYLYDLHPDPASIAPLYVALREALKALGVELAKIRGTPDSD
jgi:hypothetical protein